MKCNSRFFLFSYYFLIFCTPLTSVICANRDSNFDFDFLSDDDHTNEISTEKHTPPAETRVAKDDAVLTLVSFNAQNVLKTNIYRHTYQPLSRSPHDVPILQYFALFHNNQTAFKITPFFSSVWNQSFTQKSTHLKSYLDLEIPDIIQLIDDNQFAPFNVLNILKLFHTIKIQEHTVGFMLNGVKVIDDWAYTAALPISYVINNFYLTAQERERISNEPAFEQFTGSITEFARQHCISDRFGIGDLQLTVEKMMYDEHKGSYSLGVQVTVPTAFAFKKGMIGTHFDATKPAPELDFHTDLIKPSIEDMATNTPIIQKKASDYGYATMDRLSTILLEHNMGNNYHWGLGVFMRSQMNFNDSISLISKTSFDIKAPSVVKRFFLLENTAAEFDQFNWNDNTSQIDEKLTFLNTRLKNTFFPEMHFATVFPGVTFHSTSCLRKHMAEGRWSPSIGTDFWFNSGEHFLDINASEYVLSHIDPKKYCRKSAINSSFWIALERPEYSLSSWSYSLKAYTSFMNAGFGDALGIAFSLEKSF